MKIRDENNLPQAGSPELRPDSEAYDAAFDKYRKAAWGIVSVSAVCVGITAFEPLSEATSPFISFLMSSAIAGSAYAIMGGFHSMGGTHLPRLPKGQRSRGVAVFGGIGLLVGAVGAVASTLVFAGTAAESLELDRRTSALERNWNEASAVSRQFFNIETEITTALKTASLAEDAERTKGPYCDLPGDGPCTAILSNVRHSLEVQLAALSAAKTHSRELVAGGNYEIGQIKLIEGLANKTLQEKSNLLEERAEKLANLTNRLFDSLPITTIKAAQAAMTTNFEAAGFSKESAQRLRDQYQDVASRLGVEALKFEALAYRDLTVPTQLFGLEAVAAHALQLLPLIAVAIAPDFLMLAGLYFLLLLHWNRVDRIDGSDGPDPNDFNTPRTILLADHSVRNAPLSRHRYSH
ncbi:MAG: hypothetical protein AAFW83_02895 [Pseudomonadota bacterium]